MLRTLLKGLVRIALRISALRTPGFLDMVLASQPEANKLRAGVLTMWGSLENLKRNGYQPVSIVDVGAHLGQWTDRVHSIFNAASFLMVEANPENEGALKTLAARLGKRVRHRIALLGPESRDAVSFFQMGSGSSVLKERTTFPRTRITLPMLTMDQVVTEANLNGRLLLKLDVQGFELEILRGAERTLAATDVVIMEVSLLEYDVGAPLFAEVTAFMSRAGFVVFDICGQLRRSADDTLFQVDLMFVRDGSALRTDKRFWSHEPSALNQLTAR